MLIRRYGARVQSVEPDFDAHVLNEIGFRRTSDLSIPADEFDEAYQRIEGYELTAESRGAVQDEAEQALLAELLARLRSVEAAAGEDVVLIESEVARDYPKVRDRKTTIVEHGENRLRFHWRVEPPLRVAIYRKR